MLSTIIKSLGLSLIGILIGYLIGHHDGSLSANLKASKNLVAERDYAISKLKDAIQAKQEVEVQYEAAKKSKLSADAGARAELERLRKSIASASKTATTGPRIDGAGTVWPELFDESTSRYLDMASEAGRLSDKVNSLQKYVANVCLAND
jgi:hypothetical protein